MSVETRIVEREEADIRLDRWFRRHFPGTTQGALQRLCRTGQIRVDGKRAEASVRLVPGQAIRVPPMPAVAEPGTLPKPDARDLREVAAMTVYEDDDILVLDKPSGLATQGGPGITRHIDGLVSFIRDPSGRRPLLVHRLDRDTSGLLVLAKGPANAARLASAFRTREIGKTYWAIVVGRPSPPEGVIDAPLARLGGGGNALTVLADRDDDDAARALTEYRTLDNAARRLSLLELSPLTGRTHQLRVHCEALGTPILGDPKYGVGIARMEGFADRLHLHARRLRFTHPRGGTMVFEADLPAHMRETFRGLGFDNPRVEPFTRS